MGFLFDGGLNTKKDLEELKTLLTEQISNTVPVPDQPIYAMCDTSNFGIGTALLQYHNETNKMNLISAKSRLLTPAELRISTFMRECTAIIYTLTEYEFLKLGSKPSNNSIYRSLTYKLPIYRKIKSNS